jgi:hypothetical protein
VDNLIHRVKSEFEEMPGLRLSLPQAMRLWGLDKHDCERVVNALVASAYLQVTPKGDLIKA